MNKITKPLIHVPVCTHRFTLMILHSEKRSISTIVLNNNSDSYIRRVNIKIGAVLKKKNVFQKRTKQMLQLSWIPTHIYIHLEYYAHSNCSFCFC